MIRDIPLLLMIAVLPGCKSEERVDNVLARLVPADSVSLFGARMDQLKGTPLYQKLVVQQKLDSLDEFAVTTGFDPRRDVRNLLVASSAKSKSGVLLARGSFHISSEIIAKANGIRKLSYRGYTIWSNTAQEAGFCIMDTSLAVAGPVASIHDALDQYKTGDLKTTAVLIGKAQSVPVQYQLWAVSLGGADFLANNMPETGNAANFGKIFRSIENTFFEADLSHGLNAMAQGNCHTAADAKNLADAVKGLVGFGRLSVPDNQPELLRIWDNIQVERMERNIKISANIPQELIDRLVQLFGPAPGMQKGSSPRKWSGPASGAESHPPESKPLPR
jgi:hypothetical protein